MCLEDMFAPQFRRTSSSLRPSSIEHPSLLLLKTVVIAALFAVASSSSDICGTDFANQMHTIGPIDGDLWAITKDNWTVYKLTPCKPENDSLSHCMEVGSPVSVETKWPELAKSVKVAANKTNYNFTFYKSVIGYTSDLNDTVMAMYGDSFNNSYFGFLFGENRSILIDSFADNFPYPRKGSWISSVKNDKFYRIFPSGQQIDQIGFIYRTYNNQTIHLHTEYDSGKNICNVGTNDFQVNFTKRQCASPEKTFTFNVSRGVLYDKQFYLFGYDKVYIFLDKTEKTKLVKLTYEAFFPCKEPITLMPPSTYSNVTKARWTKVTGEHMSTTAKEMKLSTILIFVIIGIIVLLVIAGVGYYLYPKNDTPKKVDDKSRKPSVQTGVCGTKANANFSGKDMSQSKAKVSKVGSSVASMVGGKSSSKIGCKT